MDLSTLEILALGFVFQKTVAYDDFKRNVGIKRNVGCCTISTEEIDEVRYGNSAQRLL